MLEHESAETGDIVLSVTGGCERRHQGARPDQRRHLTGARAAHQGAAHQTLTVGHGALRLRESGRVETHAQGHEQRADALFRLALVDLEIGRDLLDEFHVAQTILNLTQRRNTPATPVDVTRTY